MGYAVLHINKASGNDAAMTAHIERTIDPKNADKNRTHLNRELIDFPEGVTNRTEAIQCRTGNAGINLKIISIITCIVTVIAVNEIAVYIAFSVIISNTALI